MKEIRISFTISIPLKHLDIHWLEEELLRKREEVFIEAMKKIIYEIEEEAIKTYKRCCRCRMPLVRNGRDYKKIKTLLGSLVIKRARLRCQNCAEEIYPLDKVIGIQGDCMTVGVKERALWAAVELSYEKASEFLKKFTGLEVSRSKIHRMALDEGKRIEQWEEDRRTEVFDKCKEIKEVERNDISDVFYIQVDGTAVNDRKSKEWMECKVGACFSDRVLISKNRVWLMDKKSYACIEEVDSFAEKFYFDCVRQGVDKAKEVFFIGDGARWIRNMKDNYFPDAIGVLDIWHLQREFKKVFAVEGSLIIEELKGLALRGKVKTILERLRQEALKAMGHKRAEIQGLIEYVSNNHEWIENILLVKGYGSGPIEKTVDITVTRRFKKRGMSWYKDNANPLLKLRLLKLNGGWDAYWQERRKQYIQYAA